MPIVPAEARPVLDHFRREFGSEPTHLAIAPGRVNLIGEHTDYQNGFVFPAAIDRYIFVAAALGTGSTRLVSAQDAEPAEFDATQPALSGPSWARYPAGMAWAMGGVLNIRACIDASLPVGAALSSSAALEMAFGTLWRSLGGLDISDAALARLGQKAENEFVGMNCGIMDQTASLFGVAGHALFVDTANPGHPIPIPLPDDLAIVVCDTRVKHQLQGSEYNDRRREAESAAALLGVATLREATLEMVEKSGLPDLEKRRARHIVSENARVSEFRRALESGSLSALGPLMRSSHESLRDDFEVSCPELDAMARSAWTQPGCVGARMMGGGFGGSCVALVEVGFVDEFCREVLRGYHATTGREGVTMVCRAVEGARTLALTK